MSTLLPLNIPQETSINAGKLIEQSINCYQNNLDLATLLSGSPSKSYIEPLLFPQDEFMRTDRVLIPQGFVDKVVGSKTHCRCFMGLLPEFNRAWLTIDYNLYIWSLNDENNYYTTSNHQIRC